MFHDPNSFKILLNGFIIFNDRFNDLYGFLDAIKLLEQLRNRGRNAELALVVTGTGHDRSSMNHLRELKHECRARGLERFVCWIEDINSELWPVIKAVNVLLRPTKSDGDALSVREALFLKIPVIASNVVPRPDDTVIYDINSKDDLLNKTLSVMDNYGEYVSRIGKNNISFASKIVEQYEN
jgi:glycosyltransferase involved in cell wall biosynthesis